MTAYRFCRTDDRALLIEAYERCRGPEDAGEPALDRERFKELVRELDLWCSSCMVALEGREPVGVLLGAKRAEATLVYCVRVHPAHRRRGHGRHLLTSLGQKLAILGPPRLVAEIPVERLPALALFDACQWRCVNRLFDWHRPDAGTVRSMPSTGASASSAELPIASLSVEEAVESGLVGGARAWSRDPAALPKQAERLVGLGFHSSERLEACLLARAEPFGPAGEIVALGATSGELGRMGLRVLVEEFERQTGAGTLRFSRVAPEEIDSNLLSELRFERGAEHRLFATEAKAA